VLFRSPFADDQPDQAPPSDFLNAARQAARAASDPVSQDPDAQPGFGPAIAPTKTKKGRGLLVAASGLAFLAVGAAGVIVLNDAGRRRAAEDVRGGPLEGLVTSTASGEVDAATSATAQDDAAFTADIFTEPTFPIDMSTAAGRDFSLYADGGALFAPIRPDTPEAGAALTAALLAAQAAAPEAPSAPPVAPRPEPAVLDAAVETSFDAGPVIEAPTIGAANTEPTPAEPEASATDTAATTDTAASSDAEPISNATAPAVTPEFEIAALPAATVETATLPDVTPDETLSADATTPNSEVSDSAATDPAISNAATSDAAPGTDTSADTATPTSSALTMERAAANGDPIAQYELAIARLEAGDTSEGVRLLRQSAENGLAPAQYRLGKLYETGSGVALDLPDARRWTERAANAGHVKAMHNLGIFYAEGRGAEQNFEDAGHWFEEAALLGSTDSQYNLAVLYEQGLGVPLSLPDAYAWFSITANAGDEDAGRRAESIADRLAPQARDRADEAVRRFSPRPADEAVNGIFRATPWGAVDSDVGVSIARAQAALTRLGYAPGPADGATGPMTVAAIAAYQADIGLESTGQVDATLLEQLEADANAL